MSEQEPELRKRIREHLDQGLADLDGDTLNRLREARLRATEPKSARHWRREGLILGGAAAAIVLALVVTLQLQSVAPPESMLEDLTLLSSEAELELVSDLDFYIWLQQKERNGEV